MPGGLVSYLMKTKERHILSVISGSVKVLLSFCIFLSLNSATVIAQQSSQIGDQSIVQPQEGIQVKVSNPAFSNGNLTATITISNTSKTNYYQNLYSYQLESPPKQKNYVIGGQTIPGQASGDVFAFGKSALFDIRSGSTQTFNISSKIGVHIPSKSYLLTVSIIGQGESQLAYQTTPVEITGDGNWITAVPDSCKIFDGKRSFATNEGPIIADPKTAYFFCTFDNKGLSDITVKYNMSYALGSVTEHSEVYTIESPDEAVIPAGGKREVKFSIPTIDKPQVYEALVSLRDSNNNIISPYSIFRWTVPGSSTNIYNTSINKSSFQGGEVAVIKAQVDPSMDTWWRSFPNELGVATSEASRIGTDLTNAKLRAVITDDKDVLCGQKETPLPNSSTGSWAEQKIEIPITRDCSNVKFNLTVVNNDQVLFASEKFMGVQPGDNNLGAWKIGLIVAGLSAILLGVIGYLWWKKKKHLNQPPHSDSSTQPPSATDKLPQSLVLLILVGLGWITLTNVLVSPAYADIVRYPIDNPINTPNVKAGGLNQLFDTWGNVSNFSTASSSGQSTLSISPDCRTLTVKIIGHSSGGICRNATAGLIFRTFIDGVPANISGISSTDESGRSFYQPYQGGNQYMVMQERPGARTADLQLQAPASTSSSVLHKVDIHVGAAGSHGNIWSSFQQGVGDCDESPGEPCYILLSGTYSCQGPPAPSPTPPPPPACNQQCNTINDCAGNLEGCVECRPNAQGQNTCQPPPPPACNSFCSSNNDCTRNSDGCTQCVAGQCRIPPACNVSCTKDSQCEKATDGCTSCLPSDTGTGTVCRPPAACNVACTSDNQCAKAADGCVACVSGSCQLPPACGNSCTTKAECSGAKDGCTECLEGSCTDYNDNMCKCDGIVAEMNYPNNFNFEAFGKVEGSDTAKAEIADITFRLTKDNQVVAKSNPITPEVVENSANKLRFKASWQTAPPAVSKGSTYRVFADVRCKPKRIVSSGEDSFSPVTKTQVVQSPSQPPKGLEFALKGINQLFGNSNTQLKAVTDRLLTMFSTSTVNAQGSNLQLQTLNFVKLMDTDNCRFVMFKYDESLF